MRTWLFAITFLPYSAFAFFCPNNFSQIEMSNTIDQVTQACGKPDKEETKDAEPTVPQEWSYYIPQTVAADTMEQQSGTLKASISFDKDGKAINISVNGIGVGSTTICGNHQVQLGSTMDQIKSACGKPSFINKQQPETIGGVEQKKSKITTFTYGKSTLTFTDGILTGK
jgi:hypothetical protein